MLYSKCTLHTMRVFKPSINLGKRMMGIKSMIGGIRTLSALLRNAVISGNGVMESTITNATRSGQGNAHIIFIPTPYGPPLTVTIYASEEVIKELIKDRYYVLR